MEALDFSKFGGVSTAMSHLLSSIHIKLSVIPLEIAALFLVGTKVIIMFLQLDRPPPKQLTSVCNRLLDSSIRASDSAHLLARQSPFKFAGELMSRSTHNRHLSTCTFNHDDNGNTSVSQNHNLKQKDHDLSVMVVDESCITRFNYWDQGICQGMTFSHDLYTCVQCFASALRFKAYDVGYSFAEKGMTVCITVSEMGYCVWLNLRSLSTEMGVQIKAQIQAKLGSQPVF